MMLEGSHVVDRFESAKRGLSEKTLSATFAAQFRVPEGFRAVWVGLNNEPASDFGIDARAWQGYPLFFFHFKRSTRVRGLGRYFELGQDHLDRLLRLADGHTGRAFYVLPDVGTQEELALVGGDLVGSSWLLDAVDLSGSGPSRRNSGDHYLYLRPPKVVFGQERAEVELAPASRFELRPENGLTELVLLGPLAPPTSGPAGRFGIPSGRWLALALIPA